MSEYVHGACHLPHISRLANRTSRELNGVHGSFRKMLDIPLKVKEVGLCWDDQTGREIAEMLEGIEVGRCVGQVVQEISGIVILKGDERR